MDQTHKQTKWQSGIVDRIEGDYALVETDDGMVQMPLSCMVQEIKVGDTLKWDERTQLCTVDTSATSERRKVIADLMDSVFKED